MELRTLRYFQVLAQEGSLSNAARVLGITTPTLSRQLAALEDELGRQLYLRSSKGIELTDHGIVLARYADTLVDLADRAAEEVSLPERSVKGTVRLAVGETKVVGLMARAMAKVREGYPDISFALYCGNTVDLMDDLVRGAYDFMLECEMKPRAGFNTLPLPMRDTWGIVTRRDDELATLDKVRPRDLAGRPLITSRQGTTTEPLRSWLSEVEDDISVVATYNLPLSARFLVEEGLGSMFTYEGIVEEGPESGLAFVPLDPPIESAQGLVWRKTIPSKPAQVFLDCLKSIIEQG
ncbi:LysR family transcriptional regulator [Eggerthella sinensis]|uniref:LysR family transcriptional regulator n=1 Tax=Eggerthella sinensis TaxID=242230 RepID=A0A3N0IYS9_9ACTN|nr:LysR family transcriptional regulator [Eggerthella sinensis]RDB70732.1 LysR family transcriptional regulator [Eggerthella sinensis]RNM41492.1 LysR family transcriptional regulator [Eggerthella sinensis]